MTILTEERRCRCLQLRQENFAFRSYTRLLTEVDSLRYTCESIPRSETEGEFNKKCCMIFHMYVRLTRRCTQLQWMTAKSTQHDQLGITPLFRLEKFTKGDLQMFNPYVMT